jgi:CheY-like chemotaxis protein
MRKTILVVDDFVSVRDSVCNSLQKKGYLTLGAANGKEAYAILMEKPEEIKLVITDYNMPESSGYDLLKRIKANPTLSKLPVIFLTAELSYQKMESAMEAGLFGWIKKPYRAETFFAQIESAFNSQ